MRDVTWKFSISWCIGVYSLHIIVTMLLGVAMFFLGMESFTHSPGAFYYVPKTIMWVWNPMIMLLDKGHHVGPAPLLWTFGISLAGGFYGGTFRKQGKTTPTASASNQDLIGMPRTHDSGHAIGTDGPAEQDSEQGADGKPSKADQPPPSHNPNTQLP